MRTCQHGIGRHPSLMRGGKKTENGLGLMLVILKGRKDGL
jgi:hypothetical protein